MSKFRFVHSFEGYRQLMKSAEMQACLNEMAEKHARQLGDGYEVSNTFVGINRANVSIKTASDEAYQDNLDNNTLLKSLG